MYNYASLINRNNKNLFTLLFGERKIRKRCRIFRVLWENPRDDRESG